MIGRIKNPWLRRSVLVLTLPVLLPATLVFLMVEAVWTHWGGVCCAVASAWRGPRQ